MQPAACTARFCNRPGGWATDADSAMASTGIDGVACSQQSGVSTGGQSCSLHDLSLYIWMPVCQVSAAEACCSVRMSSVHGLPSNWLKNTCSLCSTWQQFVGVQVIVAFCIILFLSLSKDNLHVLAVLLPSIPRSVRREYESMLGASCYRMQRRKFFIRTFEGSDVRCRFELKHTRGLLPSLEQTARNTRCYFLVFFPQFSGHWCAQTLLPRQPSISDQLLNSLVCRVCCSELHGSSFTHMQAV